MTKFLTAQFIESVLTESENQGYPIAINRYGLRQIDFGNNKKLHEKHLAEMYPQILECLPVTDWVCNRRCCTWAAVRASPDA